MSLLPCPFCGIVPSIERSGNRQWLEGEHKKDCYLGETCEAHYSRETDMVAQWNTRAHVHPVVGPVLGAK